MCDVERRLVDSTLPSMLGQDQTGSSEPSMAWSIVTELTQLSRRTRVLLRHPFIAFSPDFRKQETNPYVMNPAVLLLPLAILCLWTPAAVFCSSKLRDKLRKPIRRRDEGI